MPVYQGQILQATTSYLSECDTDLNKKVVCDSDSGDSAAVAIFLKDIAGLFKDNVTLGNAGRLYTTCNNFADIDPTRVIVGVVGDPSGEVYKIISNTPGTMIRNAANVVFEGYSTTWSRLVSE